MNSGARSPITGDFCLGVWKQVATNKYKLNHFVASWDSTGSNLIGPANIREDVTLTADGNKFTALSRSISMTNPAITWATFRE
jgi:hypothetical protein